MTAVMRATSVRSAQAAVGRRAGAGRRARRAAAAACAPPTLSVTVTDGTKGGEQVGAFEVVSGEKLLRDAILEEGISLYKGFAKGLNCGGVGQCGSCVVDVLEGAEFLGEREPVEEDKLRGKPATCRMACQTSVGQGPDGPGGIKVEVKPNV